MLRLTIKSLICATVHFKGDTFIEDIFCIEAPPTMITKEDIGDSHNLGDISTNVPKTSSP